MPQFTGDERQSRHPAAPVPRSNGNRSNGGARWWRNDAYWTLPNGEQPSSSRTSDRSRALVSRRSISANGSFRPIDGALARVDAIDVSPAAPNQQDSEGIQRYWRLLLKNKAKILLLALAGTVAGFCFDLSQTPIYMAHTTIEIQPGDEKVIGGDAVEREESMITNVRNIQSRSVIEGVVKKLLDRPQPKVSATPSKLSALLDRLGAPNWIEKSAPTYSDAVTTAARSVRARPLAQTRLIDIAVDSPDPKVAADFANGVAAEFAELMLQSRWENYKRTNEWLTRQLSELKGQLERSERDLQAYALQAGLIYTSDKESLAEERLRALQSELSQAQSDLTVKRTKFEMVGADQPAGVSDLQNDSSLRQLETQLNGFRQQKAELTISFTPEHYRVQRIQAQMEEVQAAMERERATILARIRNEYDEAVRKERAIAAAFQRQSTVTSEQARKSIQYGILKHEVDANRTHYDNMLQKVKEVGIASAARGTNVRVADPAIPARRPYKPNPLQNSALGLGFGLMLGLGLTVIRVASDQTVQSPGDISGMLNVPELAVIPNADAEANLTARRNGFATLALGRTPVGMPQQQRTELAAWRRSPSLMAESFRAAVASILFSSGKQGCVLVVTSPAPSEGKSTIVSNLGVALSDTNRRVLLIDADMRNPTLHRIFNAPNTWGLSDILADKYPVAEYPSAALTRSTELPNLSLLLSGPATSKVAHLLYSKRLVELTERLSAEFDIILIDTPPVLQFSDARVLGRMSDGVVLVLRSGQSTREDSITAARRLTDDGSSVIGTVLNDWNPSSAGSNYYNKYFKYYHGTSKAV